MARRSPLGASRPKGARALIGHGRLENPPAKEDAN